MHIKYNVFGCVFVILRLICIPSVSLAIETEDTAFISVRDFGVNGNDRKDVTAELLKCFQKATEMKGIVEVRIPYGVYNISQSLKIEIKNCKKLIIKGYSQGSKLPLIKTRNFVTPLEIFRPYWSPKGEVSVSNLAIEGNNIPFSPSHPFFNKSSFCSGISIVNLKTAVIENNYISNIYGNGISVTYSNIDLKKLDNRYENVTISHNYIMDCWGLHPTPSKKGAFDDYGDGIYTNSIKRGYIGGNKIVNDLQKTNQFGRAGLVLEYNDEDCTVVNNYIFGYDRNIHIEADIGGHIIQKNVLEGSDFGILIYNTPMYENKPIQIIANYISNKGLKLKNNYTRVRNSEERCLLSFWAKGECRSGSKILFNQFVIDSQYNYRYSSIVRFYANDLYIKGNDFISNMPPNKKKFVHTYSTIGEMSNNNFNNVNLYIKRDNIKDIKGSNKLVNGAAVQFEN